jgi:CRP-like cAMP-binding protein
MHDQTELRENQLLAALPNETMTRLLPYMDNVMLPPGEILYEFDQQLTQVYFPNRNTVVSILCTTDDRIDVEVGLCGNEGGIGLLGLLGAERAAQQNLVQVPGTASSLPMKEAQAEFAAGGRFQELILRYLHALFIQVSQTALCNRIHTDEERLARWLLLSHDRIESDQLPLPAEFLAKLLGRSRAQAMLTAGILHTAGFVQYNGGELTVTDRDALESVACSCYWVAKRQVANILQRKT